MVPGQTNSPPRGFHKLFPFACAGGGCALAAGLSLLWLVWMNGGLGSWDYLLPSAVLGALCGLLAARLLPLRRETEPAWLRLCMHCHAVNPDSEQTPLSHDWTPVDQYLEKALQVEISHGICPHCVREHYGQQMPDTRSSQT